MGILGYVALVEAPFYPTNAALGCSPNVRLLTTCSATLSEANEELHAPMKLAGSLEKVQPVEMGN